MTSRSTLSLGVATLTLLGVISTAPGPAQAATPTAGKSSAAIEAAAKGHKYALILFWKQDDPNTAAMTKTLKAVMPGLSERAEAVLVSVADPDETPVVDTYGVSQASMPLLLAVAPNGAVTKGWALHLPEQEVEEAFVSPCTEQCMKALQERKLVLLCVQNQKTQFSQAALNGVRDFKADTRFAQATEIVTLDPAETREASFLKDLQVSPQTAEAVTVLLAPPGSPVATFVGAVTKDQIVTKVTAAQSGPCAGGKCGPGGCCGPQK